MSDPEKSEAPEWAAECDAFARDGVVFPVRGLLSPSRVAEVDTLLTSLIAGRPDGLAPEDIMNLHWTVPEVLAVCREPRALSLACALLGTADVSVFTSRILCKLPGGKEIPLHQDSLYWPLIPPGGDEDAGPVVASMWLTFDDLSEDMGVMEVLPYSAAPATRGRSVTEYVVDSGGFTGGYDVFNLKLDASKFDTSALRRVDMARGEAEWHSAFVVHRSSTNISLKRRLVFIVRYVPTGTVVRGGVRSTFGADFPLVPVCGRGAGDASEPCRMDMTRYAPCFGAAIEALKK